MLTTGTADAPLSCSSYEYLHLRPPSNQTCGQYLQNFQKFSAMSSGDPGILINPDDTELCSYCALSKTNSYLNQLNMSYNDAWRDFGILWAFIVFNIGAAVFIYWLARVPKGKKAKMSA